MLILPFFLSRQLFRQHHQIQRMNMRMNLSILRIQHWMMFFSNKSTILFVHRKLNHLDHHLDLKIFVLIHHHHRIIQPHYHPSVRLLFKIKSLLQIQSISVSYYHRISSVEIFVCVSMNSIDDFLEPQQTQASIGGNVRSSSSSHSSFTSDEQSIFFPTSNHHYSSSSSSQIFSTNPPSLSSSSTIINSTAKPFLPTSLSTNKPTFSSLDISNNTPSPTSIKLIDDETIQQRKDADATPSHLFPSPNSFFTNGQKGRSILINRHFVSFY